MNDFAGEFSKDIEAFRLSCGISIEDFAGMLLGTAVAYGIESGIPKGAFISFTSKVYNNVKGVSNDK